jgi:hypothetical protein
MDSQAKNSWSGTTAPSKKHVLESRPAEVFARTRFWASEVAEALYPDTHVLWEGKLAPGELAPGELTPRRNGITCIISACTVPGKFAPRGNVTISHTHVTAFPSGRASSWAPTPSPLRQSTTTSSKRRRSTASSNATSIPSSNSPTR